ncbi:MAG: NAD(P)-dependent oxidoreductase [Nanoarchaeota archaeon]
MKILLTGASGFIGKNFLELAPKDLEIVAVYNNSKDVENFVKEKKLSNVTLHKCDLNNEDEVKHLFKKHGHFDNCIYLAGNVNIPLSIKEPMKDLNANVFALINFLKNSDIDRIIYMSSAAVYEGNSGKVTVSTPLNPHVPYSISKLLGEQCVIAFCNTKKIKNYAIIRFGGAFGKYSEHKFMTQLARQLLQGSKTIEVYGDGTNIINVMYAKDTINALIKCLKSRKINNISNLGQDNMTIAQTVKRTAKALNKKIKITYTEKRKDQKYISFSTDNSFNKIFNFKPKYSFEEGIKEFASTLK